MTEKPDQVTMDAVDLYQSAVRVAAMPGIFCARSCGLAALWAREAAVKAMDEKESRMLPAIADYYDSAETWETDNA